MRWPFWGAKTDTSFWDIHVCIFYKLHKKPRRESRLHDFLWFSSDFLLQFWQLFFEFGMNNEGKHPYAVLMLLWKFHAFLLTGVFIYVRHPKANKCWRYLGKISKTLLSWIPFRTYLPESNIIYTSNSEFNLFSFFSNCTKNDRNQKLSYSPANTYIREAMPQVIIWP